jgi:hypothetical protein
LFAEVYDGVWSEAFEGWFKKRIIAQVADKQLDVFAGKLVPEGDAFVDGGNGDQAIGTEFVIVTAADQIVENGDLMAALGEMEGCGPAKIAVATNHKNPHMVYSSVLLSTIAMVKNTMVK